MKTYSLILLSAWLLAGCATVQKQAYVTIGTTSVAVEAARAAFIDYANTGQTVKQSQFDAVKAKYEDYQKAMATAQVMVAAYQADPSPGADNLASVLQPASVAAIALIDLVRSYLPVKERDQLNAKIPK